jgi:hypothetical protein
MSSHPSNKRQESLRDTPVVTGFLRRTDGNDPRILIVRRSQRVAAIMPAGVALAALLKRM